MFSRTVALPVHIYNRNPQFVALFRQNILSVDGEFHLSSFHNSELDEMMLPKNNTFNWFIFCTCSCIHLYSIHSSTLMLQFYPWISLSVHKMFSSPLPFGQSIFSSNCSCSMLIFSDLFWFSTTFLHSACLSKKLDGKFPVLVQFNPVTFFPAISLPILS